MQSSGGPSSSEKKHKSLSLNTLACLAQGLVGRYTVVDLRNESYANGCISAVDGCMNITMEDVVLTDPEGSSSYFKTFFIQERNVRDIHIPKDVSIDDTIMRVLTKIKYPKLFNKKRSLKQSRLMQRQLETKKRVEEIKEEKRKKKLEQEQRMRESSNS